MTETSTKVDKSGERVKAMFAGVAPRYDLLNHLLSLNIDKHWRNRALRAVPPRAGAPILDVCTGTGDLALGYAKVVDGSAQVIGADFCPEMLAIARHKAEKAKLPVQFIEADTQHLPFADNHFQIVSVGFGIRNVADTRAGLAEMIRVCEPEGTIVILEFSRPRTPILRWMYLAYFKYLLPRVGQVVSKNNHDAYHYLPASVQQFPDGAEMVALLESLGLKSVSFQPLTFGIATLYVGTK